MSTTILEKVKDFLVKLIKDRAFQSQLENSSIAERNKFLQEAGYSFSKEEFETAAIEVLEAKERGEFNELTETELASVLGGYVGTTPDVQPMYGVVWWSPPTKPIRPQPLYGVVTDSL